MSKGKINLIVAYDDNRGIGYKNGLPWPVNKEDMERFKRLTEGHIVIMGRKTWESIPAQYKPLKNRVNVVLTNQYLLDGQRFYNQEVTVFHELDTIMNLLHFNWHESKEIFIIGGERAYREALELGRVDRVYATHLYGIFPADRWFPLLPAELSWRVARASMLNGTGEFLTFTKETK